MKRTLTSAVLLLAVTSAQAWAQAAPPPPPPGPYPPPPPYPAPPPYPYGYPYLPRVYFGQFYIRADGGGAFSTTTRFRDDDPDAPNAILGPGGRFKGGNGDSPLYDVGFGARVLPYLRWDATVSYLPSLRFSGTDNFGVGSVETAQIRSIAGFVNVYVDFNGFWPYALGPFQPYVDLGIGAASNRVGAFSSTVVGTIQQKTEVSAAGAIGAGIGWAIAPNITLDLAYRFLDLGEMRTGSTLVMADASTSVQPLKADLETSTVTLGFRVAFP